MHLASLLPKWAALVQNVIVIGLNSIFCMYIQQFS